MHPARALQRLLPDARRLSNQPTIAGLVRRLGERGIWTFNRRAIAGGAAIGLFIAFIPLPVQMLTAAAASLVLRVNLPMAIAAVWVTNPLTMVPIYYGTYRLGRWLLGTPAPTGLGDLSVATLADHLALIWQPLLVGCLITGAALAVLAYTGIHLMWRLAITLRWRARRRRRCRRAPCSAPPPAPLA